MRTFGEVEFWLASIKVLAIVVFLGAGVLFAFGFWPGASFSVPNLWEHGGFAPNGVMQLIIFTAVISVLNSGLYSASRMFSALATQGFAPKIMAKKSKRGVPVAALLASTVGGVIATIMNFAAPGSGIFEFIMNSAGLVALFVYIFIALTQMRMRQKMTPEEAAGLKLKMWLHPWLNILLIAAILAVLIVMLTTESGRTQVWTSLIATGALVIGWPFVARNLKRKRAAGAISEEVRGDEHSGEEIVSH